mmetsp:Transcript_4764/g.10101  ORF Transcript_4764/g.10101 Transcript_4764/m.10101 type:complete len:284 (-) Transcript_4764:621-1472(-)
MPNAMLSNRSTFTTKPPWRPTCSGTGHTAPVSHRTVGTSSMASQPLNMMSWQATIVVTPDGSNTSIPATDTADCGICQELVSTSEEISTTSRLISSMALARSRILGKLITVVGEILHVASLESANARATAFRELPPIWKKVSSTLMSSAGMASTVAIASRTRVSSATFGATVVRFLAAIVIVGRRLRSILLLLVRGHSWTPITAEGTMKGGSTLVTPLNDTTQSKGTAAVKPLSSGLATTQAGLTYATRESPLFITTANCTPGCTCIVCSISPSSMRWPRSFT